MNRKVARSGARLKVAVIGGGPAGSFFAMHLLHYAEKTGVDPEITIYQQRNFDELGPKGCKGCAGILSISLIKSLEEMGLSVPEEIIQGKIDDFTVHSPHASITISNPEKRVQIVSIYRGGGPRVSHYEIPISFDGWLSRQAQKKGARIELATISRIHLGNERGVEIEGSKIPYDLIVLANGLNGRQVTVVGADYVPPETMRMAQEELHLGTEEVKARLGNAAHAFLIPHSGLIFGTLVPKGPFINVSVIRGDKQSASVSDFLNYDIVKNVLPEHYESVCNCQPRALIGPAGNFFADGFVTVGDAAVTRLYKDGVGSSLVTARQAAYTVAHHGITRKDFKQHYEPLFNTINADNWWGRLLFAVNDRAKDSRVFVLAQQRLIGDEQRNASKPQPFTKAAWGMFTGNYSYKSITRMVLRPASLVRLYFALLWESLQFKLRREAPPRKLHVGSKKVLILGSGFGGTYVLRRLVPALNRNENVETTIVSDENFFLFSPLLHEVAAGHIETRHVAFPIRRLHWRDRFNFMQGEVTRIDLDKRNVTTTAGNFDFDYLVLALGSVPNIPESVTEAKEQGNFFTLKKLHEALLIRNHVIGLFEQASIEEDAARRQQLLTFVVAGAGYTGVQLVTELRDFIFKTLLKLYKRIDPADIRIILVEAESKIVAELHPKFGAYAWRCLQQMKIEIRLKSKVTQAWKTHVEINGKDKIPTNTIIWVAGVVANPRVAELNVTRDNVGRVLVDKYMEVPGFPGIYAIGDCAHFEDPRSGKPIPPRAHTGVRQAKVAAWNILADMRGWHKKQYHYSNPAEMVSLGSAKAMFRFGSLRLYGFPARLVWLVAYTLLVTGQYNRLRIVFDWLLAPVFGRDTTFIKL